MTYLEAVSSGSRRYISETPCPSGHVGFRYVINRSCVECISNRRAAWRVVSGEKEKESARKYRQKNSDRLRAKNAAYKSAHKDELRKKTADYRSDNSEVIAKRLKAARAQNPEKFRAYCRKWRETNIERERQRSRDYKAENGALINERRKDRYKADPDKFRAKGREIYWKDVEKNRARNREYHRAKAEEMRLRWKQWAGANAGRLRAIRAQRRAAELFATPAWADLSEIAAIYAEARRLEMGDGVKRHVDHIVPLQGKAVCGLHIAVNLQILTATENLSKSNRWLDTSQHAQTQDEE